MGVFTPSGFAELRDRSVPVDCPTSSKGRKKLLHLLSNAKMSIKIMEGHLHKDIFQNDDFIKALETLCRKKELSIDICFRKDEHNKDLNEDEKKDMVGRLKNENPKLVALTQLCQNKMKLFIHSAPVRVHFYVVDNKSVCVELPNKKDSCGPAFIFYEDEDFANKWKNIFDADKKLEVTTEDLNNNGIVTPPENT